MIAAMLSRAALALAVALAGCASDPALPDAGELGQRLTVRLIDASFVEFEGERITVDDFVYVVRVRCRDAARDGEPPPWIEVVAPKDVSPGASEAVNRIRTLSHDAGVRQIELVSEAP